MVIPKVNLREDEEKEKSVGKYSEYLSEYYLQIIQLGVIVCLILFLWVFKSWLYKYSATEKMTFHKLPLPSVGSFLFALKQYNALSMDDFYFLDIVGAWFQFIYLNSRLCESVEGIEFLIFNFSV